MRSLRTRLLAASLLVALTAVAVTAWAVNRATSSQVREAVAQDFENEELIYEELSFYAFANGSWDGVGELVGDLAGVFDERVALTTVDGILIADSAADTALPDLPARFIDPDSPVISFDSPPTGMVDGFGVVTEQITGLMIALEQAGVPFEVDEGFGLDYPVWDFEDPAAGSVVGRFFLEQLLSDGGSFLLPTEGRLSGGEAGAFFATLEEMGVPLEVLTGPGGIEGIDWDAIDMQGTIDDFLSDPGFLDISGIPFLQTSAEPALLFLGLAEQDRVLPDPIGWQLLLIVGLVAGFAVTATVIVSRRVLGPVEALTVAARRMEGGDLGERVEVSGADEIADLAGAFNSMAESLQTQDRLRRAMTGDIAHELRTPLSNIRGYLEAMEEGVVDPTPELIASLHEEAVLLQRLVDELQDLALAEADELRIASEPTDLEVLLERTVQAHRAKAAAAGMTLALDAAPGVTAKVDPGRIRQVIGNLLDNAIRHTDPGGTVSVRLTEGGDHLEITVADTGAGIPAEHLPHVFDRFYRADVSRSRDTGGSGLGLAIAAELVRLHGGSISVESEVGEGSVFRVRLPSGVSQK